MTPRYGQCVCHPTNDTARSVVHINEPPVDAASWSQGAAVLTSLLRAARCNQVIIVLTADKCRFVGRQFVLERQPGAIPADRLVRNPHNVKLSQRSASRPTSSSAITTSPSIPFR